MLLLANRNLEFLNFSGSSLLIHDIYYLQIQPVLLACNALLSCFSVMPNGCFPSQLIECWQVKLMAKDDNKSTEPNR